MMKATTMKNLSVCAAIACLMLSGSAMAWDYQNVKTKITRISILPDGKTLYVYFDGQVCRNNNNEMKPNADKIGRVDVGAQLPLGTVTVDGLKNILSLAMAAYIAGKSVSVYTIDTGATIPKWACHIGQIELAD